MPKMIYAQAGSFQCPGCGMLSRGLCEECCVCESCCDCADQELFDADELGLDPEEDDERT